MKKISITRYGDETVKVFEGNAKVLPNTFICDDSTYIYFSDNEVLIRKKNDIPSVIHYVVGENTFHTLYTEYGELKLNVYTQNIAMNTSTIIINYLLENKQGKLVINY